MIDYQGFWSNHWRSKKWENQHTNSCWNTRRAEIHWSENCPEYHECKKIRLKKTGSICKKSKEASQKRISGKVFSTLHQIYDLKVAVSKADRNRYLRMYRRLKKKIREAIWSILGKNLHGKCRDAYYNSEKHQRYQTGKNLTMTENHLHRKKTWSTKHCPKREVPAISSPVVKKTVLNMPARITVERTDKAVNKIRDKANAKMKEYLTK